MKLTLLLTILLITFTNSFAQDFEIGHVLLTFNDPDRNNRSIPCEIFYPTASAGESVPVSPGDFPVLVFGHGFLMGFDAYENVWTSLVPQGFIMVFPKTEGGILPSHPEFGKDLNFALSSLQSLGDDPDSLFFNSVLPGGALMGHSMGGGAVFLAAEAGTQATALAVLAPANTNPSAIEAAASVSIPALILAGGNDCVTPIETNQLPIYEAMSSTCKTMITILGGSHCQMADSNFLCGVGEITCSPAPEISRDEQHGVINSYLGNWLSAQLKSDCVAGGAFNAQLPADPAVTFLKNCEQCEVLTVSEHGRRLFRPYPNPFTTSLTFESADSSEKTVYLYDMSMREMGNTGFSNTATLDTSNFSSGIYIFKVMSPSGLLSTGKVIRN